VDEVLKIALMERMRALKIPYETSSAFVDRLREMSSRDEENRRVAGQKFLPGFWGALKTRLDEQHVVWLTIKDFEPHAIWLWRRPAATPQTGEFSLMAASEQAPADGFDSYLILSVGPLIRSITGPIEQDE